MVKQVAYAKGMPHQRFVFVPQPVMGKSPAELRAYVDGRDPVTGLPVMEEVVDVLTRPLKAEDENPGGFERSTPRWIEPDAEKNLHRLFLENEWTDRLPIVLPTRERVEAMLAATSHSPEERVGEMRPTSTREAWSYTVEKVAVNAVMAGAEPEYFPVILALAASGATARGSTTSSAAAMVVVNGPIRREIGMNHGIGAMGPYNQANATIGRAYGLLSQNLQGGSVPGKTYMGSQGNNYAYNKSHLCRKRGKKSLGIIPRGARICRRRERGEYFRIVPGDLVFPRIATKILARARDQPAAGTGPLRVAHFGIGPHNGAPVRGPGWIRHQGKAEPLGPRQRHHARGSVLGLSARRELSPSSRP